MPKAKQREKPPPLRVIRPQDGKHDAGRSAMVALPQYKQPLIVHVFSPEVIQTSAHDFMNLVQKLTGNASHVSPLAKRPRLLPQPTLSQPSLDASLCMPSAPSGFSEVVGRSSHMRSSPREQLPRVSNSSEEGDGTSSHMLYPLEMAGVGSPAATSSLQRSGFETEQGLRHNRVSELALRRGLSPRVRLLQSHLETASSPWIARGIVASAKSPEGFEFSPSMLLPTPTAFLRDFPSLPSPQAQRTTPPSPVLAKADVVARGMMTAPATFPSPGPLTTAFLADLPSLSPAAQVWIENHPLSAELMLSPLSRGFGLSPRPPPAPGY